MGNKNVQQGLGGRSRRCTIIPVSFLERDSLLTRERGRERMGGGGGRYPENVRRLCIVSSFLEKKTL